MKCAKKILFKKIHFYFFFLTNIKISFINITKTKMNINIFHGFISLSGSMPICKISS